MGKREKKERKKKKYNKDAEEARELGLHPDTKKSIVAVVLISLSVIFLLSSLSKAGPAGNAIYAAFTFLLGIGYYLIPAVLFFAAITFLVTGRQRTYGVTTLGSALFVASGLGLIDVIAPHRGGLLGSAIGAIEIPFGYQASLVVVATALIAGLLLVVNAPIRIRLPRGKKEPMPLALSEEEVQTIDSSSHLAEKAGGADNKVSEEPPEEGDEPEEISTMQLLKKNIFRTPAFKKYTPPPLSLLRTSVEKPMSGDLRANANTIKRTLESFDIPVEMGEISVGPKITRYALKPAEGIKLARIIALHQDMALALATHPIRIEAPIPGKSLVGIEVPNKTVAVVRLGTLMKMKEVYESGPLCFVLGKDVSGEPIVANIATMPHLLVAGATGSGKSVAIHSLILSLLYKNSPETLRMVMVDPKKVELSVYEGIPHLVAPVVTESKKAIGMFRWALSEMDRRYELLMNAKVRDIEGYNKSNKDDVLPYILIIIDELADLMSTYGREVEGSIVRLAQMARAVGIHLVLSTQRPSVEVITGLIKANITSRIALQVASQIDSRTILDTAGAEKLLGEGDLLFVSAQFSKPRRIQGAFITEREVQDIANFIRDNNADDGEEIEFTATRDPQKIFDDYANGEDEEDELYENAVTIVTETQKASASFLQRRMKVGYARAARLLDIMENKGIIGPSNGAKPREVYVSHEPLGDER